MDKLSRIQSVFFQFFIITLFICWSPVKVLAYIIPALYVAYIGFLLFFRPILSVTQLILLFVWLSVITFSSLVNEDFVLQNAILSLITYGSAFLFFTIPSHKLNSPLLTKKVKKVLLILLAIQAPIGIVQGIYSGIKYGGFSGAAGDAVEGTIHLPLPTAADFSNPIFTVGIILYLIYLIPYYPQLSFKSKILIYAGVLSVILASVLHVLLFSLAAIVAAYIFFAPGYIRLKPSVVIGTSIVFGTLIFIAFSLIGKNIKTTANFVQDFIIGRNPKVKVINNIFNQGSYHYPQLHYIGLGPGQVNSRAALIGTEQYIGGFENPRDLPLIEQKFTEPFNLLVKRQWENFTRLPANLRSSTTAPFCSWISFYAEFGLFGFLVVILSIVYYFFKEKIRAKTKQQKRRAFAFGSSVLLIFLLGIQENYWEYAQIIFPAVMLIKIQQGNLSGKDLTVEQSVTDRQPAPVKE